MMTSEPDIVNPFLFSFLNMEMEEAFETKSEGDDYHSNSFSFICSEGSYNKLKLRAMIWEEFEC